MAGSGSNRVEWIDIAKGIAIISVVYSHTLPYGTFFRTLLFAFHMPVFFLLAGYTLKPKDTRTLLATSAKRLLLPYFLLEVSWFGIACGIAGSSFSLQAFVLGIVGGAGISFFGDNVNANAGMPWFLLCLFVSRLITNSLLILFNKYNTKSTLRFAAFFLLAAAGVLLGQAGCKLPFCLDIAFIASFLMWCGHEMACRHLVRRYRFDVPLTILAAIIWVVTANFSELSFAGRHYDNIIVMTASIITGCIVVIQLSRLIDSQSKYAKRFLVFMGRNSMLVYCIHVMDWWVDWLNLPLITSLPGGTYIAGLVRLCYIICLSILFTVI